VSSQSSISVVIRIRNEAAALRTVLRALSVQNHQSVDVVVVDNASSDDSKEVAKSFGARVLDISKEEFTYGRALNRGIDAAEAERVVVLSAHALPLGRDFLEKAVEPFKEPLVAGVRCLHVGNPKELNVWMEPWRLDSMSTLKSVVSYGPVACACAIRKSVWQATPFDENVTAVEDKLWALRVLQQGYLIANSEAMYLYMRDIGFFEKVRKMNRDRLEFFRKTGVLWQEPPVSLKHLMVSTLHHIPKRSIRTVAHDVLLYLHLKTIPLQARKKQRIGSVR
jgi:rhamnosyltransferase